MLQLSNVSLIFMDNESVDLIIYDDILEKDLLEECFRILRQDGTLWLITNKNNIVDEMKLIREVGFINNFENWWTINIKDYTKNFYHLTMSENYTFNQVEIKRDVVVPYTIKGKNGERIKRGWDYEDGKPKRWTGISNCSYLSDESLLNQLFMLVSSNENDVVYDVKSNSFLKRDYNLLKNISTSEDCQISFNKRSFMPK